MTPSSADIQKWLLHFSSTDPASVNGAGRPWGDGTEIARRAGKSDPWDVGCKVTPLIGGYRAMNEMRESLKDVLKEFPPESPPMQEDRVNGHVYITGWRLNPLRDLSSGNSWKTSSWADTSGVSQQTANSDETAFGLFLRLMQSRIQLRILLWLPNPPAQLVGLSGLVPHIEDHFALLNAFSDANKYWVATYGLSSPLAILALDTRVNESNLNAASHHQKMMVIRAGSTNVAYCGGVDLAYTRRDAPKDPASFDPNSPAIYDGDWQSGSRANWNWDQRAWPEQQGVYYPDPPNPPSIPPIPVIPPAVQDRLPISSSPSDADLPPTDGSGNVIYGSSRQLWHDQHLKLEGPIVFTLENQFCERWIDQPFSALIGTSIADHFHQGPGLVVFSGSDDDAVAIFRPDSSIIPLPDPSPIKSLPDGSSTVQMWRTIPLRSHRTAPPFVRGEFTIMKGISNACAQATEVIWIFDQYFWNRPLARQLNQRLSTTTSLYIILFLPPYADDHDDAEHYARFLALSDLLTGNDSTGKPVSERVHICCFWKGALLQGGALSGGRGVYCHAKVQMYDGSLLVCGSANLNRRSFAGDTEVDCAVLDPALVNKHQKTLWGMLFPSKDWPSSGGTPIDLNNAGAGKQFFEEFVVNSYSSPIVWVDTYWLTTSVAKLPSGASRTQEPDKYSVARLSKFEIPTVDLGCLSLTKTERQVKDNGNWRACRLDDVVKAIEEPAAGALDNPYPNRVRP